MVNGSLRFVLRIALEVRTGAAEIPGPCFTYGECLDSKHREAIIYFFDHGQWLEVPGVGDKSFYARNAWKTPCRAITQHDESVEEESFDSSGRCEYTIVAVTRHSMHDSASCRPRHPLGLLGRPGGQNHHNSNQNMAQRSRMESEGFRPKSIGKVSLIPCSKASDPWWGKGRTRCSKEQRLKPVR